MIAYEPGETLAHRLDPRAKLAFQFGFAIAAVAHTSVVGLAASFAVAVLVLTAARLSPLRALRAYLVVLVVLGLGPILAGLTLGPPWFEAGPALDSLRAVLRIVPVLLVSAAVVHTTAVREVRAAIQWTVPGRLGRLLGTGVGLLLRFLPVVRRDVGAVRDALAARGGDALPVHQGAARVTALSIRRVFGRADALSVALRTRCFAYNPTLPALALRPVDVPVLATAGVLAVSPLLPAGWL
jgi:biotin transport system permease protein